MKTFTPEERSDALALWRDGSDTLEIANILGCDEADIYNNLPRWRRLQRIQPLHRLTARHKRTIPPEKERDYRNITRKGFSAQEAAEMLGIA